MIRSLLLACTTSAFTSQEYSLLLKRKSATCASVFHVIVCRDNLKATRTTSGQRKPRGSRTTNTCLTRRGWDHPTYFDNSIRPPSLSSGPPSKALHKIASYSSTSSLTINNEDITANNTRPCHQHDKTPLYHSTTHNMADAGDLGKLPAEIRKEIYSYLLVERKKIGILRQQAKKQGGKVARIDHHRNKNHRGKFYDRDARAWKDAPPCITSLLFVNKSVSAEASQVLYGFNKFEFVHAGALECFLRHVGPARQYIRSIALVGQGVLYKTHWASFDRSVKLLAQATSLRTLEVSHLVLCGERSAAKQKAVTPQELVQHCKPLLKALQANFEKQNLSMSIFDVIKIFLPRCTYDDGVEDYHKRQHRARGIFSLDGDSGHRLITISRGPKLQKFAVHVCNCVCEEAEENTRRLLEDVKAEIVEQLGMSIGGEQTEEAV
jgi:hypothetical protein